ncbi:MAG: type IV pilus secretin PilQ [Methylococcaceae bacterium]|nr:type IV pilus secretin PilQ [Methylococcaceae bacterium]
MTNKQIDIRVNNMGHYLWSRIGLGVVVWLLHSSLVNAGDLALSGIDFASQAGDKLQVQLEMTGPATAPKIFKTDNPARIALDFQDTKSALPKKMYSVNQGAVNSIYVVEAAGRVRVVVNLLETTPFETQVEGNKVLLTLTRAKAVVPGVTNAAIKPLPPVAKPAPVAQISSTSAKSANNVAAALLPSQAISGFDFKRGEKGEGRILVNLANPNTIVNSKEEGGKVIINFLNTQLSANMSRRLDVSEFATPVKFIDTVSSNKETTMTVAMQNNLYDYSVFQSNGLLTVEFRPLTNEEKDALDRSRVKYTGNRLSLNFQEIEIRSVIAILAEFTGQNVVAGDDVSGTITLKLDDVPWDEALDFIMMTKELGKFESGNVTLISPLDKIKEYKKKQEETEKVVEQLDPLVTEYVKINYAKAESFRNLLNGRDTGAFGSCSLAGGSSGSSSGSSMSGGSSSSSAGSLGGGQSGQNQNSGSGNSGGSGGGNDQLRMLSPRGSAIVDARTNTLIVRETAKRLEEIKKLIRKLDVPVRQVMIESRIVIASNSFLKELGTRFGVAGKNVKFGSTSGAVGSVNPVGGTVGSVNGTAVLNDALVDLAASNPYGALGMTLARGADYVLNLELSALQDEGKGEIVSNPRVMTSDRCQATIKQGEQIPYKTVSQNGTQTQLVDAVLQLDVTPQITPSGSVVMNLKISKDARGAETPDGLGIDTREIETNVHVMDGETVVLGGVFEGSKSELVNKVPFLADLPGIGFLFTKTNSEESKKELLIFITPKIVTDNSASN